MGAAEKRLVDMTAGELLVLIDERLEARARSGADDLLTIEQAAAEIGCSVTALLKRIQRNHLKPDKLGGKDGFKSHQFTRATIAEYKRSNKR